MHLCTFQKRSQRNLIQDLESASLLGTPFTEKGIVYLAQEQRNFMHLEMLCLLKMRLEVLFNIKKLKKRRLDSTVESVLKSEEEELETEDGESYRS